MPYKNPSTSKTAIIIGAGPAGLTAARELLDRTGIVPIVFEMSGDIGGLSKTVNYKGNLIDIGGHRLFSKSERVMQWWQELFPIQGTSPENDPEHADNILLVRDRLSRIFFLRKLFDYPFSFSNETVMNLGFTRILKIFFSYTRSYLAPITPERSLEDFFINRFGEELYRTFFKDYTEKVWGVPCSIIRPEWGVQRIKGLSVIKMLSHAASRHLPATGPDSGKQVETSLIEHFLYPKFGPGQLWEEVARRIESAGGRIVMNTCITGIETSGNHVTAVITKNGLNGETSRHEADYLFSSMPVRELISALGDAVPTPVREIAGGLLYRDFMTVGLLLKQLKIKDNTSRKTAQRLISDNWIYIQEPDVKLGRIQIFNNWSPYMVKDPDTVWVGLEYFCTEGDELWTMPDADFISYAIKELASIDIIDPEDVLDATLIRMPKAYPAYFGSYDRFDTVRDFTDCYDNLFLIGRNGMHRYNNIDHSMLTAMAAVENIITRRVDKSNIWQVNAEDVYNE